MMCERRRRAAERALREDGVTELSFQPVIDGVVLPCPAIERPARRTCRC
jgi:hypothetical protein